ncbi:MAG TPA: dihydrolipoamide acetyltransferase family protein [Anaerolineales bacterium]|nr:dihydrolipoamide acetyltransferase family protein [Anaerolineales bacterium]
MAEVVSMPKLGFDMAEGTLVRWVIAEGKPVEKGAVLAEIETDKATVEVESTFTGTLRRHLVEEGAIVPVNTPIAVIGSPDEEIDVQGLLGEGAPAKAPLPTAAEATLEQSPEAESPKMQPTPAAEAPAPETTPGDGQYPGGVRASPLARRMAEEQGIDIRLVKGSGPRGRIVRADVEAALEAPQPAAPAPGPAPAGAPVAPVAIPIWEPREDQKILLSRLRGAVGRRMVQAKQQIPHFYVTHEYDMANMMKLRAQLNGLLPEGEKISVNDFLVKAAALTLREFPNLNAALDEKNNQVIRFGHINIGVAVAVENGLLTVVCRDADQKTLRQISAEVRTMASRVKEGKVKPDDIEGSTFSTSNLGMFDVAEFIAIINPPEAAILAIGSVREVPVVEGGEIKPGMRMKATISADHRVSDGAEAARFMQAMAKYLEEPLNMMM